MFQSLTIIYFYFLIFTIFWFYFAYFLGFSVCTASHNFPLSLTNLSSIFSGTSPAFAMISKPSPYTYVISSRYYSVGITRGLFHYMQYPCLATIPIRIPVFSIQSLGSYNPVSPVDSYLVCIRYVI